MKQLKVSLPDDLRAKLDKATTLSDKSLGDEIRTRLERTFDEDSVEKPTRDLIEAVKWMAAEIRRQVHLPWYYTVKSNEAMAAAMQTWLEIVRPPRTDEGDLFGPDDPPTLGRSVARHYQRLHEENELTAKFPRAGHLIQKRENDNE